MRLPTFIAPRHRVPLLILFVLALAYWSKVLFTGQVLLPGAFLRGFAPFGSDAQAPWTILQWDALGQYYPWREFAARELHAGRIPLWNPHQFAGTPLMANGQSAVLYPPNIVFWLFDPAFAFGISAFLHTLLAAFSTYFLAQHWRMSRAASLLAAIAFAFCGYLASWAMLPTLANTAAWLPFLLCMQSVVGSRQSESDANFPPPASCLLPPALACALLAGHAQVFFYLLVALFIHALFQSQRRKAILQLLISGALAGMFSAIQILPTLELARLGHRAVGGGPSAVGWQGIAERALSYGELLSLFIPAWPMNWGSLNESFGYVGFGVCLLMLCALIFWRRLEVGASPALFAATLTIFGLLYALATPLPQLFYWTVPGLSQMGGVGRALLLWSLGAALLAGFGLDALRRKANSPLLPAIALIIVTAELFVTGWNLHPIAPRDTIYPATQTTTFLQKNLREGERVWFITPRGGWLPTEVLQSNGRTHPPGVLPPNGATVYRLNDINGYDSLAPRAYREWLSQFTKQISPDFNGNMILLEDLPSPALDALNVRFIVTQSPRDIANENEVLRADNCVIYERSVGDVKPISGSDLYPGWKQGVYQPETFRFGAFLSLCALAFLLMPLTYKAASKRPATSHPARPAR